MEDYNKALRELLVALNKTNNEQKIILAKLKKLFPSEEPNLGMSDDAPIIDALKKGGKVGEQLEEEIL